MANAEGFSVVSKSPHKPAAGKIDQGTHRLKDKMLSARSKRREDSGEQIIGAQGVQGDHLTLQ